VRQASTRAAPAELQAAVASGNLMQTLAFHSLDQSYYPPSLYSIKCVNKVAPIEYSQQPLHRSRRFPRDCFFGARGIQWSAKSISLVRQASFSGSPRAEMSPKV
jgi:hypothetical protein